MLLNQWFIEAEILHPQKRIKKNMLKIETEGEHKVSDRREQREEN